MPFRHHRSFVLATLEVPNANLARRTRALSFVHHSFAGQDRSLQRPASVWERYL